MPYRLLAVFNEGAIPPEGDAVGGSSARSVRGVIQCAHAHARVDPRACCFGSARASLSRAVWRSQRLRGLRWA